MSDSVVEIKSRLSIEDVVGQYVQLKKAGRNLKGLCPFHSEKSPSFVVSPEKQICHCFGCNKGGDIFTFIQEVEGVSFSEALDILGDRAGVKIEKKAVNPQRKSEKEEFLKAHELACDFFEDKLWKTNDGKKVLAYLKKRGVKEETVREFRLGFTPDDYEALHTHLAKKGISRKVMIQSGFVSAKDLSDEKIYDKFRARLMFPIFDYLGKIVGFGGRALKKDQMPKYLNSPENAIYHKSKVMYGMSHAKKMIKEKDEVVLVEGYFDVILPHQEGVENVVATSGTALTTDHVKMIKRLTPNVVSCFDNDNAGFEATLRAYELVLDSEMIMKSVSLDEKDPADFVMDHSGEEFADKCQKAQDFLSFYLAKLLAENDPQDLDGRREILSSIVPFFKKLNPTSLDFYVRDLSTKMNIGERVLYDEIRQFKEPKAYSPIKRNNEEPVKKVKTEKLGLEDLILSLILLRPDLMDLVANSGGFEQDKAIYKELLGKYNSDRSARSEWNLSEYLEEDELKRANVLYLYAEDHYGDFGDEVLKSEVEVLLQKLADERKYKKLSDIQKEIVEAEKSGDNQRLIELLQEHKKLLSKD